MRFITTGAVGCVVVFAAIQSDMHAQPVVDPSVSRATLGECRERFGLPEEVPFNASTEFTPPDAKTLRDYVGIAKHGTVALSKDKKHFVYTPHDYFLDWDTVLFANLTSPRIPVCKGTVHVIEKYTREGQLVLWHRSVADAFWELRPGDHRVIFRRINSDWPCGLMHWKNSGGMGYAGDMRYDDMPWLHEDDNAWALHDAAFGQPLLIELLTPYSEAWGNDTLSTIGQWTLGNGRAPRVVAVIGDNYRPMPDPARHEDRSADFSRLRGWGLDEYGTYPSERPNF